MTEELPNFGTHGGHDHFVITDSEEVRRIARRDFADSAVEACFEELASAAPYVERPTLKARIQLAMLNYAMGDLSRLREARTLADRDWRDLLMATEYKHSPTAPQNESPKERTKRQHKDKASYHAWRTKP